MGKRIAFIGCGNMGGAVARGIVRAGFSDAADVVVTSRSEASQAALSAELGCAGTCDNAAAVTGADVVVLGVKPQMLAGVAEGIAPNVDGDALVVSLAAGVTLGQLAGMFRERAKIVRVMPNLPAMVGEGMSGVTPGAGVSAEELDYVLAMFSCLGRAERVPEHLIGAVAAVSGSSPAYVALFVEALADGAVTLGMPRAQAYTFAEQAVLGTAKFLLETGQHPGAFKDAVCSPAGTTIAAVAELERGGLRASVMDAMLACDKRNRELAG